MIAASSGKIIPTVTTHFILDDRPSLAPPAILECCDDELLLLIPNKTISSGASHPAGTIARSVLFHLATLHQTISASSRFEDQPRESGDFRWTQQSVRDLGTDGIVSRSILERGNGGIFFFGAWWWWSFSEIGQGFWGW